MLINKYEIVRILILTRDTDWYSLKYFDKSLFYESFIEFVCTVISANNKGIDVHRFCLDLYSSTIKEKEELYCFIKKIYDLGKCYYKINVDVLYTLISLNDPPESIYRE